MLKSQFDIDSDTWKVALVTSSSNISTASTTWAGVTNEHANQSGAGYLTGGKTVTFTLTGTTSVDVYFTTNPSWTATGGAITARWAVIYESGGDVLCFCLLDSTPADYTAATGRLFTINSGGTPLPVFRAA